jgi:diguanylate cyclase (GGDEF)-like protein
MDMPRRFPPQRLPVEPGSRVRDPRRLASIADAELHGHLGDEDLNAVVATLRIACRVPIAVVNVVTHNLQTYPAEVGIGAPCTRVPDQLSFCAEVVETGAPVAISDASSHPVYGYNPFVTAGVVGAYAGVPLVDDGYVLGSVSVFDDKPRVFTADELEVLAHQARLASSILALRRSARTDVLTGLANRALLLDRLRRALSRLGRHEGMTAVMFLDVNEFKALNDSYGHETGDWVLVELAHRLSGVMRPSDTLARFGGDEFVIVCEDVEGARGAEQIAARLLRALEPPWLRDGDPVHVTVGIGIAVTAEQDTDPADLLRHADAAMYRAKSLPGSSWVRAELRPGTATAAS